MNYIINPWVFYLLNILENVVSGIVIALFIFGIVLASYAIIWCVELSTSYYDGENEYPSPLAIVKKWKIPLIICIVVLVLTPSKETCYKMLIASQVTTENIESAKETVKEVADYIVESAKEIKEKTE
jgi:hypothetical protein